MTISEYIDRIKSRYKTGISTEHSYRGELLTLVESLVPGISVTNEPKRVACGAPDYIITKKNIPVGYIEAKDIGADLNNKVYKEQFDRYRTSLSNLLITDYLEFKLFLDGTFTTSVSIGEIHGNKIIGHEKHFQPFTNLISSFCTHTGQTIKSASKLSKMMAVKARLMADVIEKALTIGSTDNQVNEQLNLNLHSQYDTFKQYLIHDISEKGFADIYAQTIAYGMFAARLNDASLVDFSRFEAAELIPKSNPFLRNLFQYIASYNLDDRIKWMVDELADIFRATNVSELLKDFGKSTQQRDPIIHFYETFLSEYDPKLRKSRGVWYTPEPVVNFIVRAVDDILKDEFGLPQGLADTSKIKIKVPGQGGKPVEKEVHRVQILDPAAGTGTFLAEVIKQIHQKFEGQQGIWNQYVDDHLIPRLNGFEILMASYAMAHLKLDMLLKETGYKPTKDQRLRVYLTNSLEEHHPDTGTLFANWLSSEANEANHVKRDTPVMVLLGNPPYSGISINKGEWISNLIEDYKYIDGVHFGERKHWLQDDYVKFMRLGEFLINKNGEGILAFINNHSFIDNPTFRGMRWHLLRTFDKIYIIDLHGSSKKKEDIQEGMVDENVFDIQQGVSLNIFIKQRLKKGDKVTKIFHHNLFGTREFKYEFFHKSPLKLIPFKELNPETPNYFFYEANLVDINTYNQGFHIGELFVQQSMGITTARDHFVIDFDSRGLLNRIKEFTDLSISDSIIRERYFGMRTSGKYLPGDTRGWNLSHARVALRSENHLSNVKSISYRPFDERFIYYSKKVVDWGRDDIMRNLFFQNYALVCVKVGRDKNAHNYFVTSNIADKGLTSSLDNSNTFPLYCYTISGSQKYIESEPKRLPNLNQAIVSQITSRIGDKFTDEKTASINTYSAIDILDYIYAILYSPIYRERYKDYLKIDFPRIPYPLDKDRFWQLVKLGEELRQIHLLASPAVEKFITTYSINGSNEVGKIKYESGKVWINNDQCFDGVLKIAWDFFIGGYQPAQKWLKDRKGRVLSFDDIMHYQKIIVALTETDRLMKEIDKVDFM